jgi:hypothetical protein
MAQTQITLGYPAGTNEFINTSIGNSAVTIKANSGTLFLLNIDNTLNAAASFLKMYDTNGAVVVGTTVPDVVIKVPALTMLPVLFVSATSTGLILASGIQAACVTVGGTTGVTSPTSAVTLTAVYS